MYGPQSALFGGREGLERALNEAEVEFLVEKSRSHRMSPEEQEAQMVSFVYGNQPDERIAHTKAEIREILNLRPGPPDE